MKRVVKTLKEKGVDLSQKRALDFFARAGDWQTSMYIQEVNELYAWEIDSSFEKDLRKNLPGAEISIGNSFDLAISEEYKEIFDFIVFDNPQNLFGGNLEYCEHFQALPLTPIIAKKNQECVAIFNVNSNPFDYEKHPVWASARNTFYSRNDCSKLDRDFILNFYRKYLASCGLDITDIWLEDRNPEYLHYLVCIFEII